MGTFAHAIEQRQQRAIERAGGMTVEELAAWREAGAHYAAVHFDVRDLDEPRSSATRRETRAREHRASAPRPTATTPKKADPPPPPATVVSDQSAFAAVGMTPRQFRELLAEHRVTYTPSHGHVYARMDHVLAALGLADAVESARPRDELDEATVIQLAAHGRRGRS